MILASTLFALFPGIALRGEVPDRGDLTFFHRPVKAMMLRLWAENDGVTPGWAPYLASGQPFRANPHFGAGHPSTLLFRVLPFDLAFLIWVLLPLPLGAAGMYLLLRELGRSRDTSILIAAAWAFGGFALSTVVMPPVAWTAMLAPGAAAFVLRAVSGSSTISLILAAAGTALCIAGGAPVSIVAAAVVVLAAIWSARIDKDLRTGTGLSGRMTLLRLGGVVLLAAALAAPVVLPGAALSQRSVRVSPDAFDRAAEWSLPALRLLEPWHPRIAGDPKQTRWAWSGTTYAERSGSPLILSLYSGMLVSALALAGAVTRRKSTWPWIAAASAGAIAALGSATPVWGAVVSRLPLIGGVRYPEKWIVLPVITAVVLAASALDNARNGDRWTRKAVSTCLTAAALFAVFLAVSVGAALPGSGTLVDLDDSALTRSFVVASALTAGAAIVTLVAWQLAPLIGWRRGVLVLAAVLAVDLGIFGNSLISTQTPESLDRVPADLEVLLTSGRPERLFDLASWQPGCRTAHPALPPRPVQWGIPLALNHSYDLTQLLHTDGAVQAVAGLGSDRPDLLPSVLANRGVTAVFSCSENEAAEPRPVLSPVRSPRPGISCAEVVIAADGRTGWSRIVRDITPAEIRRTVIVDRKDPGPIGEVSPCRINETELAADHRRFDVEAVGPERSFVVVTQTWDRYWRATVDGNPVDLERCEISLTGLWIEPGKHLVELQYDDPNTTAANFIGLAGAFGCLALLLIGTRHRKNADRADEKIRN